MTFTLGQVADLVDPQPSRWLTDPVGWVQERAGAETWSKQREILESIPANRRTAVRSCHESGKSWDAGQAACWWIDSHPIGSALVVTTADTFTQVKGVLWQEIGKTHRKLGLPGRVNLTEWWCGPILVGLGRKPADTDPTALQGLHREHVLVIVDEADGVPIPMWDAVHSLSSAEEARCLAIGNPVDPNSHFARICQPGSGWNVITIDALETPNFTGEAVSVELGRVLISPRYVDEVRADYGEGSPAWQGRVRGVHPTDATDSVVRIGSVRACQHWQPTDDGEDRIPAPAETLWTAEQLTPVELGVDVGASAGGDRSVIMARFGVRARPIWRGQTSDAGVLADQVVDAIRATGAVRVRIDATGVGWAVADLVRDRCKAAGIPVPQLVKVMVGTAASRPNRFPKLRDQIWWEVGRQLSEDGGWDLTEIDEQTIAQLTAPRYQPDTAGRTRVEKKDETKKRLGHSPDDADALLLAFAQVGEGAAWLEAWRNMTAKDTADLERGRPQPADAVHLGDAPAEPAAALPAAVRRCKHFWSPSKVCVHCGIPRSEVIP